MKRKRVSLDFLIYNQGIIRRNTVIQKYK